MAPDVITRGFVLDARTEALLKEIPGLVGAAIEGDLEHVKLLDEETNRTLIIDGILMIRDSKSPALVREMLLAYLPEKHRHDEGELVPA